MNDPLESIIEREDFVELIKRSEERWDRLQAVFFPNNMLEIWLERRRFSAPIRNLAMKHHMSRYHIRQTLGLVEQKISALNTLLSSL